MMTNQHFREESKIIASGTFETTLTKLSHMLYSQELLNKRGESFLTLSIEVYPKAL